LYYQGDISLLSDNKNKIAVVGSRKYSKYGKEMTEKLVKGISKDFVIVSGLALGIDAIAHRSCIASGGKTIAVLANGIDFHYLEENM
jgi:DNA processing protein